jgi:DUF4097 and DUF4098 domain-containing protein YvlB
MIPERARSLGSVPKTAFALTGLLLLVAATPASAHHLEKHFPVAAHPIIAIHNPSGTITVRSWPKQEVAVVADHPSDKVEVDAEQNANRIDVITHVISESASPADLEANYQLTVPEDAELQIHSDSGAVAVTDVLGDMAVDTVAAGVQLEDTAGYLSVKTVGGSFDCFRCAGRIEAQSISGNLRIFENRSSNVRFQSSTGNLRFEGDFLPSGTYLLKNYSGTIEVRFSPDDSFDLSATSLYGKVINEANLKPPAHSSRRSPSYARSLFGTFNLGRAKVDLTSFSGTISIRKRE